ncbi:STAS domain-containing protein [Mycolicibacterium mengxianglii]|uniref:hypothetical protein n=1 Tax=Mycolicibacterium mengxianglii TaxID=2736649 RepID=UPI0018EEF3EC|nr:hypothetical protein [Mycolicibacterium mengxianglii]
MKEHRIQWPAARGNRLGDISSAQSRNIQIATEWPSFDTAKVVISGEVDASNCDEVLDYALRELLMCRRLVLDLTSVRFFACNASAVLRILKQRCGIASVELQVLESSCVTRALRVGEFDLERTA